MCSYAKVDYSRFMNITAKIALKIIPAFLKTQPVFLCVDDTTVSKFGTKFEDVSKLFDHAAHNGSNYLKSSLQKQTENISRQVKEAKSSSMQKKWMLPDSGRIMKICNVW